jgi:hypothetical protein
MNLRTWLPVIPVTLFLFISGCRGHRLKQPDPEAGIQERIEFYLARLPDRDYVQYYELQGTKVPWYLAAEELGGLGSPAIPPLMKRVQATSDPYWPVPSRPGRSRNASSAQIYRVSPWKLPLIH